MTASTISTSDSYNERSITTSEARNRLEKTLFSTLESGANRLIDAPTSLGKSYKIATTPWREYPEITGGSLVIHIHQTTEARDDAVTKSQAKDGIEYHILEGRQDSCPVAAGDYDDQLTASNGLTPSEWFEWMCDVRKVPFSKAHERLNTESRLPCMKRGQCPSHTQWWHDLRNEDGSPAVDVVHTTKDFAHVEELIEGANVVFDERPNYAITVDDTRRQQLRDALSNLLDYRSKGDHAIADIQTATLNDRPALTHQLRQLLQEEVNPEWYFRRGETHRLATEIGQAMLNAGETIANQCADKEIDLSGRWMGEHDGVRVVMNSNGKLKHIQNRPDLSAARCVIGLDAYPCLYRWRLNTVEELKLIKVLSEDERRRWRREERGLKIVQVARATRSYSNGWRGAGNPRAAGLIHHLRGKHDDAFRTAISPTSIEDDVRRMMEEVGIEPPDTMHYGGQNSLNDFGQEPIGLLVGCIDPGDKTILDLLALGRQDAFPELMITEDGEKKRKPGRPYVGPDADVAKEILGSVRETNLAQAAGRYARNPDSASSSATVYVWSDACPSALVDEMLEPSYHSMSGKRKNIAMSLKGEALQTALQLSERLGVDKSYTLECLRSFESFGLVYEREGTGHQGASEWDWKGGSVECLVDLE